MGTATVVTGMYNRYNSITYVQICWILDVRSSLVEAFARLGCYAVLVAGYRRFVSIFKGQAVFD
jgi:hypothetical protein